MLMEIGPGRVEFEETRVVASGTTVRGIGPNPEVFVCGDFPAFRIGNAGESDPEPILMEGFAITRDLPTSDRGTAAKSTLPLKESVGVHLWGKRVVIRDVAIANCFNAIRLGDDDSAPSRDICLERVSCTHKEPLEATSQFGLFARNVDGMRITDCDWADAWLDGIKLQKHCRNVHIIGGRSHGNGRSSDNPDGDSHSGDGIDCFAGAEDVRIEGTLFDENHGNGVVIKTVGHCGDAGVPSNPEWGAMRNIELCGVVCRDNTGHGIVIEGMYDFGSPRGGATEQLRAPCENERDRASDIRIDGVSCERNTLTGVFANGIRVELSDACLRDNSWPQLEVGENSRNFTCARTSIIRSCPPPAAPVLVEGERLRVYPAVNVQSGSEATSLTDLRASCGCVRDRDGDGARVGCGSSKAPCARWGVFVEDGARDVSIDPPTTGVPNQ